MRFYIGSYTRLGGVGVGMCSMENNCLKILRSDALPNATYLILNKAQTRLYAICSDPIHRSIGGSVAAYDIADGKLLLISRFDTIGAGPCHLCLDFQEKYLYVANYFSGSVSSFALNEDGSIRELLQHICHVGKSVHPTRQAGPHTHQVTFIPETNFLCAVDLGLDQLIVYHQDTNTGLLTELSISHVPAGFGPRHVLYGKAGQAYLVGEIANQVAVLQWNETGFQLKQMLSTLPDSYTGTNTASAIRMKADRLYVSNRGHNSIAVYDIAQDGLLKLQAIWPTNDDFPRDFHFADDNTLLIGHQNGALTLEKMTGSGLSCIAKLEIKGCVCVQPTV